MLAATSIEPFAVELAAQSAEGNPIENELTVVVVPIKFGARLAPTEP
jgi:hypothetical protein